MQDLGYKGEIGYQTFLYSNEPEIRSLLMFLVEKLPRESAEALDQPAGTDTLSHHCTSCHLLNTINFSNPVIHWSFVLLYNLINKNTLNVCESLKMTIT